MSNRVGGAAEDKEITKKNYNLLKQSLFSN